MWPDSDMPRLADRPAHLDVSRRERQILDVLFARERATAAKLPDVSVEVQAGASHTAWQILEAGVMATKSLDDKAIGTWLKANRVDTIQGKLRFDGTGNYGDDLMRIKQVQGGHWTVVWPKAFTHGGATLLAN